MLGELNILNIVGSVAIADKLGMTAEEIKVGAKYLVYTITLTISTPKGRMMMPNIENNVKEILENLNK